MRPPGYDSPFLQRHCPSGEVWADYVATGPPTIDSDGRVTGAWGECIYAGVCFEITNPDWQGSPGYEDDGPVGIIITYANNCGYGQHEQALLDTEESCKEELNSPGVAGSRAFLNHKARNGQTWMEYLGNCQPETKDGMVVGAWGECITAAVIFEHENPQWNNLGPYSEDGPAGQVLAFLCDCGYSDKEEKMDKTEKKTHEAVEQGRKVPVFDSQHYQAPIKVFQATEINRPAPSLTGRKRAVLIGCNYPGQKAQLSGCVNDVHRWAGVLQGLYGFQRSDMVQLTDEGHSDYQFFPTRSNILNAIRWLVSAAQPGDVLFLHFSGHGGQVESKDYSEADGLDETLIPTDYQQAGIIVDHELFDLVVVPLPSGCKLTVILDCCHSGSALDLPFVWNEGAQNWETEDYPWHTAGDVQMFSGCEDSQCSMDASSHGRPAGAMTTAMCDVLERYANEPPGPYHHLLGGLTNVLMERGFEQRPRLSSSQAFNVNEKPFSITDFIVPNSNPQLGQAQAPRPKPGRQNNGSDFFW